MHCGMSGVGLHQIEVVMIQIMNNVIIARILKKYSKKNLAFLPALELLKGM